MTGLKFSPIITPFVSNRIDGEKLLHHADNLFSKGIDGIFLCGSTSLCPSLSFSERMDLLGIMDGHADRIIYQVGSLNLEETLRLAEAGKKAGVRAIAAFPPYYYPNVPDHMLEKYYLRISSVYPTFIYNFPLATGHDVNAAMVKRIRSAGGNIVGIKDTLNDPAHMMSFKVEFGDDFTVFSGPDFLVMNAARIGIDGVVCSSTNYAPEIISSIFRETDPVKMMKLQDRINRLVYLGRRYGQLSSNYVFVKALQGYDVGEPREPVFPLTDEQKMEISEEARRIVKE